jgi:hypothetical protein
LREQVRVTVIARLESAEAVTGLEADEQRLTPATNAAIARSSSDGGQSITT